mmetsp:Transcript_8049/g.17387  ORF Transcript_8049/g.17387 Transcript_8049/m.17387 type:complete len:201 (+) Transcript_8049:52-654(+)
MRQKMLDEELLPSRSLLQFGPDLSSANLHFSFLLLDLANLLPHCFNLLRNLDLALLPLGVNILDLAFQLQLLFLQRLDSLLPIRLMAIDTFLHLHLFFAVILRIHLRLFELCAHGLSLRDQCITPLALRLFHFYGSSFKKGCRIQKIRHNRFFTAGCGSKNLQACLLVQKVINLVLQLLWPSSFLPLPLFLTDLGDLLQY